MSERASRRKGGGRAGRREARGKPAKATAPFIERNIPYVDILSEENLQLIEHNADRLLAEIGIDFLDDREVLDLFREAGADVEGTRVRFPIGMCRQIIQATAPSEYIQHARNPLRSVTIGGKRTVLAPAYGSPFVHDLDKGRRYATIEDFQNFVKLAYMAPGLHHSGGTVCEPVNLPVNKRHYDMVYSHFKYSDKPLMGSVTHWRRAQDSVDMAKIVFGDEFVDQNCVLTSLINVNSPLVYDATMLGSLKVYAKNNQATVVSPFILSGAMSPVTVTGTVTQILAEAMAGIALTQLIRPGCPVIFGTFAAAVSMATGAPTFGTPEPSMVIYAAGALARRLGVPFRSGGGLCGSKLPDAQAAYEAANTLQTSALAGVNFMLHTAGWLEGGLAMGYEKFIMDCDQASMIAVLLGGMDMSENGQAMSAFEEVGPGKHFLGSEHTLANFETAFYRSTVADNNSYEQWSAEGRLDAAQRANALWKKMLAEYQAPELDPAIDEALQAFMTEQKASFADRDY
jgi:trimethylamine--corrinoid protein Co-methyltransferase